MMRPRVTRGATALLASVFFSILSAAGWAQNPSQNPNLQTPQAVSPTVVADVLSQGKTLETQHRWPEAFALYGDAARQNPGQPELEQRLDLAKIHFDIGRRYSDASFHGSLTSLSDADALETYTDTATKLNAHYVQNPDWAHLFARGTADMEIALSEQSFLKNNLSDANSDRINLFLRELRKMAAQKPITNKNDAREAVWNAGQMGKLQLGLRPSAVIFEYTAAMMGGLDEYSSFLTSGQLNDLYSQIEGNFVGLGVELKAAEGSLLIVNVIHKSPAERAGIKPGDKIVAVGDRSTTDLSTDQAAELLQGTEGSSVDLAVATGDQAPRRLTVRREHVDVPSVDEIKIVDTDLGIGYFKLSCFEKTTAREVDSALWQLHRDGMRSLVIDLRGNPGGLLTSAVEVADKFIEQGSIVSTRGRSPGEDFNYTAHGTATWRMPMVVLIDGDSASAAEILAGALRDYHRATIVGVRSYGKGSVQGIFPLDVGGAGVRITTAKFYSPLGKPFAHIGVDPDLPVRTAAKPVGGQITVAAATGGPDDAIFNAGLQAARRQVAQR
jgi:carboxyl-terminal processing protease